MKAFLKTIELCHNAFIKEAFVAAAGRGLYNVGRLIVKNPLKTTGLGLTAHDVITSAGRASQKALSGHNIPTVAPKITM